MTVKGPQSIRGEVKAPGSKAYTHRALVASLLTRGETAVRGALECDDTKRTREGISSLKANVRIEKDRIVSIGPQKLTPPNSPIDCGESGATLRFLTAVASVSPLTTTLKASGGLAKRPLDPLLKALNQLGASATSSRADRELELRVRGPLRGGETSVPGNTSSQFISGLLFAAPLADSDVVIGVDGEMESRPYVSMTVEVLRKHGIRVESNEDRFHVPAPQEYKPAFHQVPGDFSSASFLVTAAATGGEEITITGLGTHNLEPDSAILDIAPQIGLEAHRKGKNIVVERSRLHGFQFDASNNPDLVPSLEVIACFADGPSEISGVRRLQYKETDRLRTVPAELVKMGARIQIEEDIVKVKQTGGLTGTILDSHKDHRVAMACTTAALSARGKSVIEKAEAVSKSYPDFFHHLAKLGADIHVE